MSRSAPNISILKTDGHTDISPELLLPNGKMKLLDAAHYKKYNWQDFRIFCHNFARYGIPTTETIARLKEIIDGRHAIEIGAGYGDFGHHLGITMTDYKIQNKPDVAFEYMLMSQPTIKYPDDVEELEALQAVDKYSPKVVIASWVTSYGDPEKDNYGSIYGIKEREILSDADVETFILMGNLDIHGDKPIMKLSHKEIKADWIVSRAKNPENNRIFVWNCKDMKL